MGRGTTISEDPSRIFEVFLRVFGDVDTLPTLPTLPTLQHKFFSYRLGERENLLVLSLRFVEIYDRICQLYPAYQPSRQGTLKRRLAEAAKNEGLLHNSQPFVFLLIKVNEIRSLGRCFVNQTPDVSGTRPLRSFHL